MIYLQYHISDLEKILNGKIKGIESPYQPGIKEEGEASCRK